MKNKNNFAKFAGYEVEDKKDIKGGFRAAMNNPGGSGGSSWIDWGDMDVRTNFGQISIVKNRKLGSATYG